MNLNRMKTGPALLAGIAALLALASAGSARAEGRDGLRPMTSSLWLTGSQSVYDNVTQEPVLLDGALHLVVHVTFPPVPIMPAEIRVHLNGMFAGEGLTSHAPYLGRLDPFETMIRAYPPAPIAPIAFSLSLYPPEPVKGQVPPNPCIIAGTLFVGLDPSGRVDPALTSVWLGVD